MTDLDWRPAAPLDNLKRRAVIKAQARDWFAQRAIIEVDTSPLCLVPVSDPNIESVEVQFSAERGRRYLQTSPEHAMKRLLAAGAPDIYQMCTVFRDGEAGARHQPDFTLIEWYRHGYRLEDIVTDTVSLLTTLLDEAFPALPVRRQSFRQAFVDATGCDPVTGPLDDLIAAAGNSITTDGLDRDQLLDWMLISEVVPTFPATSLTVLHHYPASQAALARLCPNDNDVADRFEVFLGDLELANGFVELTSAEQQRRRFEADLERRTARGDDAHPLDEQLLAALECGLPACSGVAVGFDRVLMLALDEPDIRRVQAFPACP